MGGWFFQGNQKTPLIFWSLILREVIPHVSAWWLACMPACRLGEGLDEQNLTGAHEAGGRSDPHLRQPGGL